MDIPRRSNRGIEENTLAILDSSAIGDDRDVQDDRLSFLEAVRSASLVSVSSSVPTWKMYNAIFHILRDAKSLEEAIISHQLLVELEKHYPISYLANKQKSGSSLAGTTELAVAKEAWSPFISGLENAHVEGGGAHGNPGELLDAYGFSILLHDIAQAASSTDSLLRMKLVKDMLLFQYLVDVLDGDFIPRQTLYRVSMSWVLFRESLLSSLLGSRKVNFRNLIRDCMTIMPGGFHHHTEDHLHHLKSAESCLPQGVNDGDAAMLMAMVELEKKTCNAVGRLLILIMELDVYKKVADVQGDTSRADAVRIPLLEIIVDELSYNKDSISPFLAGFPEPKWKLEIVLHYFWKYCNMSSVQTRRSHDSPEVDATLETVFKHFSTVASARSLVRKMTAEVAQLLLAHAFQAYLSLQHCLKKTSEGNQLLQISKDLITAYENVNRNKITMSLFRDMEILPFEKEALFTAATIVALES